MLDFIATLLAKLGFFVGWLKFGSYFDFCVEIMEALTIRIVVMLS